MINQIAYLSKDQRNHS